jgi:hypothetical protein
MALLKKEYVHYMNITTTMTRTFKISNVGNFESIITAFIEDLPSSTDPKIIRGKVTISCYDRSWHVFLSNTEHKGAAQYFKTLRIDSIMRIITQSPIQDVIDIWDMDEHLTRKTEQLYSDSDISKDEKEEILNLIENADSSSIEWYDTHEGMALLSRIWGEDYLDVLPKTENPEYSHLKTIISIVKRAI